MALGDAPGADAARVRRGFAAGFAEAAPGASAAGGVAAGWSFPAGLAAVDRVALVAGLAVGALRRGRPTGFAAAAGGDPGPAAVFAFASERTAWAASWAMSLTV